MFCRQCGKQIEDGRKFCPFCGAAQPLPVAVSGVQPPAGGSKGGMKKSTIAIIVALAVLVVAGAALGIYFGVAGSSSNSTGTTSKKTTSPNTVTPPVTPSSAGKTEKIAYLNNKDIYVVSLDGTGTRQLTTRGDIIDFAVSPAGTMMAFVSQVGEQHIIFKMNADGTKVSQVTLPEKGAADNPAFDPTGKYIYFTRVTPQDQALIQANQPYSTGFERYNIEPNNVNHLYSFGGLQEQSIVGLFPDPAGGNLYFNHYGSDFPSSTPYVLTLGADPTATAYMPIVTEQPPYIVLAYQLTGFSTDGTYLAYYKQADYQDNQGPNGETGPVIYACYKELTTGTETSVASYTLGQSSQGNVNGMQFSSVDISKYYFARVSTVGPGTAWTLDFYKGTTKGKPSLAGLSITIADAQNTTVVWHPIAAQK